MDVAGVGYDVYLPEFVMRSLDHRAEGEPIELEIYYHVTERQVRPTLIGFNSDHERRFFEKFISVSDVGPQKAARALTASVSVIAQAIENEDVALLRQLPGIGERTARKVVATLRGKVAEEALLQDEGIRSRTSAEQPQPSTRMREDVIEILVDLGHRQSEATSKVDAALNRKPDIETTEELIREVYRGEHAEAGLAG